MENLKEFIRPELLVLVPVLYIIGTAVKSSDRISDKHIPLILGIVGIALSALYIVSNVPFVGISEVLGAVFAAITQGILCAGASVYVNQIIKQEGVGK